MPPPGNPPTLWDVTDRVLVLLHRAASDPSSFSPVLRSLADDIRVLTPQLPGLEDADPEPFTLERAAETVRGALAQAGLGPATVCGVGLGAVVALRLAADHPGEVQRLVLLTRQTRLSPVLMSLPAAVLRLVPATVARRLGVSAAEVIALLDQVRPVDVTALARTVSTPTVVLCGARDALNRHTSAVLARLLPQGELRLVPRVGTGWLGQSPELFAQILTDIVGPA